MKKLNNKEIQKRIDNIYGKGVIKLLGSYNGMKEPVPVKHLDCGHIWPALPNNLIYNKSGCPNPIHQENKMSHAEFEKLLKKLGNNEYTLLSKYKNQHTKVTLRHDRCKFKNKNKNLKGWVWDVFPTNFIHNNSRCPYCAGNLKKKTRKFQKELKDLFNGRYVLKSEYKGRTKLCYIQDIKCGEYFQNTPEVLLKGYPKYCPICKDKVIE